MNNGLFSLLSQPVETKNEPRNSKTMHVYKKARCKKVEKFCPDFNPKPHSMMRMAVQDLKGKIMNTVIETKRLVLRTWQDSDLMPMCAINQDPLVMEYFPSTGNLKQTRDHIKRIQTHQDKYGYSLYAVELKQTGDMIGFVGLLHRTKEEFDAPFIPATEIGWRLSSKHWNKGYATEAALAVLEFGFTQLGLHEIVSFANVNNKASRRVMEKIGLQHNPVDDFDHTKLDKNSPLRRHVLYRIIKTEYAKYHIINNKGKRV